MYKYLPWQHVCVVRKCILFGSGFPLKLIFVLCSYFRRSDPTGRTWVKKTILGHVWGNTTAGNQEKQNRSRTGRRRRIQEKIRLQVPRHDGAKTISHHGKRARIVLCTWCKFLCNSLGEETKEWYVGRPSCKSRHGPQMYFLVFH